MFRDSKLQLIFTYPVTSNEGERRFTQLKDLLTSDHYGRAAAINNLMLMGAHRTRLSEISNSIVIDKFNGRQGIQKLKTMKTERTIL